jgi:hypothetical protein
MDTNTEQKKKFTPGLRNFIRISFLILSVCILFTVFVIIQKVAKPIFSTANEELVEQYGNRVIAELSRVVDRFEEISIAMSKTSYSLQKDSLQFKNSIPVLLNNQYLSQLIAGGGIWPDAYRFHKNVERRSFFWGKNKNNELVYFTDYNNNEAYPYFKEEWFTPARYLNSEEIYWSQSYMDPYSYEPMVTCTCPIYNQEEFWGVSTLDIKLTGLNDFLLYPDSYWHS